MRGLDTYQQYNEFPEFSFASDVLNMELEKKKNSNKSPLSLTKGPRKGLPKKTKNI